MPPLYKTEIEELDAAARANLSHHGVSAYESYKSQLLADGTPHVEEILRGWIWDESESEA